MRAGSGYALLIDPNRNWSGGTDDPKQIDFSRSRVQCLYVGYTDGEKFAYMIDYLFSLYRKHNYQHRIRVVVDEAHTFTAYGLGDYIEQLMNEGRRFMDVTLISTRAAMLRTSHGYVALSQANRIVFFKCHEVDLRCIQNNVGVEIPDSTVEHIGKPYHYAVIEGGSVTNYLPVVLR